MNGSYITFCYDGDNRPKRLQIKGFLTQNLPNYEWSVKARCNASWSCGPYYVDGQLSELRQATCMASLQSEKFWMDRSIAMMNFVQYSYSGLSGLCQNPGPTATQTHCFSVIHKLTSAIHQSWHCSINIESQWANYNQFRAHHYLDASLSRKRLGHEIAVTFSNITNQRIWTKSSIQEAYNFRYEYTLRPRNIAISYRYSF